MQLSQTTLSNLSLNNRVQDVDKCKLPELIRQMYQAGKPLTAIADSLRTYLKNLQTLGMVKEFDLNTVKNQLRLILRDIIVSAIDYMERDELKILVSDLPYIYIQVTRTTVNDDACYLSRLIVTHKPQSNIELLTPHQIADDILRLVHWD